MACPMPPLRHHHHHDAALPSLRGYAPYQYTSPKRPHQGFGLTESLPRAHSLPSHIDMGAGEYEYLQGMLPAAVADETRENADAPSGCCDSPDDDTRYAEEAGHAHEDPYTTRLMPRTSLIIRFDTLPSKLYGNSAQWAVMKSLVTTARNATT